MAEKNITILQKNSSGSLDTYYPKTIADQVVESDVKMFMRNTEKEQYDANTVYTNATPIVEPIGQIEAGDTFNNVGVATMLTKILYPYVQHELTASASVASRVVEKGVTTNVTSVTANVVKKSEAISKVELFNGATLVEAKTDGVADGGTVTFSQSIAVTDSTVLKVKATDAKPSTVEAVAAEYVYVYPFYHGAVAESVTLDSAAITGLTKTVAVKGDTTFTFDLDDNCAVIAYPAAYGDAAMIVDRHGFDNLASFDKSTVNVTGTDGTAQSYIVYKKLPATATGFDLTVKF